MHRYLDFVWARGARTKSGSLPEPGFIIHPEELVLH